MTEIRTVTTLRRKQDEIAASVRLYDDPSMWPVDVRSNQHSRKESGQGVAFTGVTTKKEWRVCSIPAPAWALVSNRFPGI